MLDLKEGALPPTNSSQQQFTLTHFCNGFNIWPWNSRTLAHTCLPQKDYFGIYSTDFVPSLMSSWWWWWLQWQWNMLHMSIISCGQHLSQFFLTVRICNLFVLYFCFCTLYCVVSLMSVFAETITTKWTSRTLWLWWGLWSLESRSWWWGWRL